MGINLPADLEKQLEQELCSGRYETPDQLIAEAIRCFFEERDRAQRKLDSLAELVRPSMMPVCTRRF
jgi:Arc/MetJ-type ribon-helix-helix transcriptional regulator